MRIFQILLLMVLGWVLNVNTVHASTYSSDTEFTSSQDTLYIIDFLLCRDVVEREPIDIVQSYTLDDERAWAFARIFNNSGLHDVHFRWFFEDDLYFEMASRVGDSPNWRTYSSVTLQPGTWRVEIYNDYGVLLREIRFHVST